MAKPKNHSQNTQDGLEQTETLEELFEQPNTHVGGSTTGRVIVMSFVVAVISGIVTGLIGVGLVLSGSFSNLPVFSAFSLETLLPEQQVIIRQQQAVTLTYDGQVNDVVVKRKSSLATIVSNAATSEEAVAIFGNDDVIGYGFVLSSDGWLVTLGDVVPGGNTDDISVIINGQQYVVESSVLDPVSNTLFMKVPAEHLLVAPVDRSFEFMSGDRLLALSLSLPSGQAVVHEVLALRLTETDTILSTEELTRDLLISDTVTHNLVTPVFSMAGEVIGLKYSETDKVLPASHFAPIVESVLGEGVVSRPYLGLSWIDLRGNPGLPPEIRQGQTKGAYINAVAADSPAAALGISEGDIIKKIQTLEINGGPNFAELVQRFKPKESIILSVLQGDEEVEVELILDVLEP